MSEAKDTLFGGREVSVTFRDGTQRVVFAQEVKISLQTNYAQGDNIKKITLATDLNTSEVDELTHSSYKDLSAAVKELNDPLAVQIEQEKLENDLKQLSVVKEQLPDVYEKAEDIMLQQMVVMMSRTAGGTSYSSVSGSPESAD